MRLVILTRFYPAPLVIQPTVIVAPIDRVGFHTAKSAPWTIRVEKQLWSRDSYVPSIW